MTTRFTVNDFLDAITGWRGAGPGTRARLLRVLCTGVRLQSLITNSLTLILLAGLIIAHTRDPVHVAWVVAVIIGGLLPRLYAVYLRRSGDYDIDTEKKALAFLLINTLYGLIWGAGPFLFLPELGGADVGIFLFIMVFGSIMGPYAAMPGIFYIRLLITCITTLIATFLYTSLQVFLACLVVSIWLVLRTDVWRGYHRTLRKQLELQELLEARQAKLESANLSTRAANVKLQKLASTDPLTGAVNRRELIRRIETLRGPTSLLLLDIDYFKDINDNFGHPAGDAVLIEFVTLIQNILRKQDVLSRIGGEEFAIVLNDTDSISARGLAERIRRQIEAHVFSISGHEIKLTISIGIVTVAEGKTADGVELMQKADSALYQAKQSGRNRIETIGS